MKRNLLIAVLSIVCFTSNAQNKYAISGTAKEADNGKKIVLEIFEKTATKAIDSTVIKNGKFEMNGKFNSVDIALLKIDSNTQMAIPIILEPGKIVIALDTENLSNSKVSGTKTNVQLFAYTQDSQNISKKMSEFQQKNMERFQAAQASNNQGEMDALMAEYNGIQDEVNVLSKNFIAKSPDSFVSVLLIENLFQRQTITSAEALEYLKPLSKDVLKTAKAVELIATIASTSQLEIGNKAPDFSGPSPDGKMISLKESLGKVTIIDFWASWCGPCRKENPSVVAMYNELHPQGLNIIGVSLDRDKAKWLEAIEKDKLTWNQVSSLKFWQDPIAVIYNIKSIPSTWILDKNGVIVAKDLRGEELKAKIIELLKQ